MNVLSINIRGLSEARKVEWINDLKIRNKIDFIGVQETHISEIASNDVAGC